MNVRIVDKIRALQRVAKSTTGPEAESARRLADELQRKYDITVVDEDGSHRVLLDNIEYWRGRILHAIAARKRCRVLDRTDGKPQALLVGHKSDVDAVLERYRSACAQILVKCSTLWQTTCERYSYQRLDSYDDRFRYIANGIIGMTSSEKVMRELESDLTSVKPVFVRAFLNSAADRFTGRFNHPAKKPTPQFNYPLEAGRPQPFDRRKQEKENINTELKTVPASARNLLQSVLREVDYNVSPFVNAMVIDFDVKLLMQASSFGPPPRIELDEISYSEMPTAPKLRREIDIDY